MVTNSSRASPASGLSGGQSPNPTLYGRASPHNEFTQSMTEATATAISRTSSKKGPTQWVRAAKSRASGTIRKHLFGKSRRTKDAEDLNGGPITERPEEDEFDDFTQSNYDTVKSVRGISNGTRHFRYQIVARQTQNKVFFFLLERGNRRMIENLEKANCIRMSDGG